MRSLAHTRDRKVLERRRLAAGRMFYRGKSQAEVARHFGVSTAAACQWHAMWEKGEKALRSKGPSGVEPRLSSGQRQKFKQIILKGARSVGYDTDFWTLGRLKKTVKGKLGKDLGQTSVWRLVTSLGFSPQKPELRARERNEEAITDWKLRTFPRLKKMG